MSRIGTAAVRVAVSVILACVLAGSGGAQALKPVVKLVFPTEGAVVSVGDLKVLMSVSGATLKPADAAHDLKTGHFHLYLDKVPEPGRPIPQGVAGIWHWPETSFTIKNVTPGVHTLILIWAFGDHVPYAPWVSHTVMFEAQ